MKWEKSAVVLFSSLLAANAAQGATSAESPYDVVRRLGEVLVLVEREYVDPVKRSELLEGSIRGMVQGLDPHSDYLEPKDYAIFKDDTQGQFGGIGVEVDLGPNKITVISPIEGSPAQLAGIQAGDRIIAINGERIRRKKSTELIQLMRGKPGSEVSITVERDGVDAPKVYRLTREVIEVSSVAGKLLDGDIAYLRIKQFQRGSHTELLEKIGTLREASPQFNGVILDLRNNPGGLVDEARGIADEFLTQGTLYTTRHRNRIVDDVGASEGGALTRPPMVVLVNGYSASASELVAGALKDNERATVVGSPTYGKGSVQTIINLSAGTGLRLTTMRYYTPSGHAVQARGILPNITVEKQSSADKRGGLVRENELPDHLKADASAQTEAHPKSSPQTTEEASPEPAKSDTHLGVARKVPQNPSRGPDTALSVAYELVLGKATKAGKE